VPKKLFLLFRYIGFWRVVFFCQNGKKTCHFDKHGWGVLLLTGGQTTARPLFFKLGRQ
jgi:hypothetical protein